VEERADQNMTHNGEAIVFVNKEKDVSKIYNSYVIAQPTDIESQLSKMPLLRQQLLSVILINDLKSIKEVLEYISLTFYYHEFGNDLELNQNILDLIDEFISFNFLIKDKKDNLQITELGKKVCLLYLDPYSANNIINDLEIKEDLKDISDTSLLFTITNTRELYPYVRYKADLEKEIFENFEKIKQEIYFEYEDLNLLQKVHLSFLLTDWINEASEEDLLEKYNTTPGQLQDIINKATWIIHCILELSKIKKINLKIYKKYLDLELRLKYGVKEEILELVHLKNIGKIRARRLYVSGITSINHIKKIRKNLFLLLVNLVLMH
jgi:helicase